MEGLLEVRDQAWGKVGADGDGEVEADSKVAAGAKLGEDSGAQAVPDFWGDGAGQVD